MEKSKATAFLPCLFHLYIKLAHNVKDVIEETEGRETLG